MSQTSVLNAQTAHKSKKTQNKPLHAWQGARRPTACTLVGQYCKLMPLEPKQHGADLYAAYASTTYAEDWAYLPYGPFSSTQEFADWLTAAARIKHYYVISTMDGQLHGLASFMNIEPQHGTIEVGAVKYARSLQKTTAATEAMFLMMRYAFEDLGYRRYQWCCDSRNQASCQAALRHGFQREGILRQAKVVKAKNRDTAVFSILEHEWPQVEAALSTWLHADNFNANGQQKKSLTAIREYYNENRQTL